MSNGYPPPQQPGQPPQWQGQQPGQYPQQPGPGWAGPAPVPPPRKSSRGPLIAILGCSGLLVLGVVGGVLAVLSTGGDSSDDAGSSRVSSSPSAAASSKAPPKEKAPAPAPTRTGAEGDITITACEVNGATTWPAADVEIVNHSSSEANYIVSVEFLDSSGTRLGEGMAATNNLAPGQKARAKAQALSDTKGKVTCKVSKVTRYPSG